MKLSASNARAAQGGGQAQSVVERRNTIPILANVLIEAEGAQVSFRATDLDIEVVDRAPAMVERAGATTVSAVMLHEIVRKLPDGALVNLTEDAATGRLTCRRAVDLQPCHAAEGRFPGHGLVGIRLQLLGPGAVLRRLFDKAKFAISTEETRYYLNGVYMHVARRARRPRCCAAWRPTATAWPASTRPCPKGRDGMPGVIVPRKTVGELRKLLDDDEARSPCRCPKPRSALPRPAITLTSKVIDGTFPDYTRVIPTGNTRGWRSTPPNSPRRWTGWPPCRRNARAR
jgi:DNA polymerase III subunit beta